MATSNQIWSIDSINDDWASVEVDGGQIVRMPVWLLPPGAREGDVYAVQRETGPGRSVVMIVVDEKEKARRLARSRRQVERRAGNDPGGDITL
jgi:hypothetical protein